jgi:hypothetical protein
MPIPSATLTIADGSLGISPAGSGKIAVVQGVCSKGTPATVYGAYNDIPTMVAALGYGPAVEAAALAINGGASVYVVVLTPLYDGAASTVTKVGSGAGVVATPLFAPAAQITLVCTTTGLLGTAAFTYKIGTGTTSAPVTSAAGWSSTGWLIPGTMTKAVLTEGTGFDAGDTITISTVGVCSLSVNAGASTGTIHASNGQVSQPFDDYTGVVEIRSTGAEGVGTFRYTLDSFTDDAGVDLSTWSADILIPSGLKYALPNTGVFLTFSSASYTDGDTHSFTTCASGFNTAAVTAGFTALYAQGSLEYNLGHTAGMPVSAAGAATLAGVVDTNMTTAETAFRYLHWYMDVPTVGSRILSGGAPIADTADTDSTVASAFAAIESKRVVWGAGDFLCISPLNGRLCRRPASWLAMSRAAVVPISENLHRVKRGALKNVRKIYRDESSTEVLDAARFLTLRTHIGKNGYFITKGRTAAQSTSDYSRIPNRRVMDRACQIARSEGVELIGEDFVVNDDGTIAEKEAQRIEKVINKKLTEALVDTGNASRAVVVVNRAWNLLSTSTLKMVVRVTPRGSSDFIEFDMGFTNPALADAA